MSWARHDPASFRPHSKDAPLIAASDGANELSRFGSRGTGRLSQSSSVCTRRKPQKV